MAPRSATSAMASSPAATASRATPLRQPASRPLPGKRAPLRIVPPPESRARRHARRRARVVTTVLAVLSVSVVFAILGLRVVLAQGQVGIDLLEAQVAGDEARNQHLRLEVARLESPQRIVEEARTRLGMLPPEAVTYLAPVSMPEPPLSKQLP